MHRQRDDILNANSSDAADSSAHDAGSFDPGPSFADPGATRPLDGGLPSWLQNFAEVAGHEDVDTAAVDRAVQREPSPPPHDSPSPARSESSTSVDFFIDDDLPEWLRTISVEQPVDSETEASQPDEADVSDVISVPSTSRAWVSPHERAESGSGSALFAAIAHEVDQRPDIDVEQPGMTGAVATPSSTPPSMAKQPQQAMIVTEQVESESHRLRLVLLVALVVFVVLVVMMLGR